jgi:UDP-glucose 4-epimerase
MSVPWFMYWELENDGKLYFSSSCLFTVKPKNADYWRCIDSKAMSPYGNTKQIGEEIITDVAKVSHINAMRYFNPIEHFRWNWRITYWVPQNLPFITQTGFDYEKSSLLRRWLPNAWRNSVYSRCLAKAHVIALQRLLHKRMLLKSKHST